VAEVKNDMEKGIKTETSLEKKRKSSSANYMMLMTFLALFVIILVNVVVNSIDTKFRQIDLSQSDLYSLTDTSKKFLDKLDEEITIYTVAEAGNTNQDLERLLSVYASYSDNIKLEKINPALNPQFLMDRDISISQGSIVVEYKDKSKGVELSEMVVSKEDENTGKTYYIYDMEGQITSAINYVITKDVPKAYMITGSGRDVFDDSLVKGIKKQNIDIAKLSIIDTGKVPEDADILILDQPAKDLTEVEFNKIKEFMDNGGSLMILQYYKNYSDTSMPYFNELIAHYGIAVNNGVVVETDSNYLFDEKEPFYAKPVILEHEITNQFIKEEVTLLAATSDRIELIEKPKSVTVTPLLTSSSKAYYKEKHESSSMAKLATDPVGTFNYAVAATDDISDKLQSKLIYISSFAFAETDLFEERIGNGNGLFVVNSMKWLADQDTTISIPVELRSFSNLIYSLKAKERIRYIVIFIIPVAVLSYGGYVWYRRRKR
jgi:ABC-2 type transport system permease protein